MPRKPKRESFDEEKHSYPSVAREIRQYEALEEWLDAHPDFLKEPSAYQLYLKRYERSKRNQKKLTETEYIKLLDKYEALKEQAQKKGFTPAMLSNMDEIIEKCLLGQGYGF